MALYIMAVIAQKTTSKAGDILKQKYTAKLNANKKPVNTLTIPFLKKGSKAFTIRAATHILIEEKRRSVSSALIYCLRNRAITVMIIMLGVIMPSVADKAPKMRRFC